MQTPNQVNAKSNQIKFMAQAFLREFIFIHHATSLLVWIRMSITVFTNAWHRITAWSRTVQSIPSKIIVFYPLDIILFMPRLSKWSFNSDFPAKVFVYFSSPPQKLSFISSLLILHLLQLCVLWRFSACNFLKLKFSIFLNYLNITLPWLLKELRTGMTEFEPHHWHSFFFSFSSTPPVILSYSSHPALPSYINS